jgi:manganese transport protein
MMLEGIQTRQQQMIGQFPAVLNGLRWFGPAFLVSVGYMDPGNWATDIEGGSRFSYQLLWVILASSLIAIFLQVMSAKLGIATGKGLAENSRDTYPRPIRLALWAIMEMAMIATDLAEFMGSALGISLLFHIPLLPAVLITGLDVLFILWLERFGFRVVEVVIIGLVMLVGWAYVIEILMVQPAWSGVFRGMVIPTLNSNSLLVAVGILGATVMPHNLFLHSTQIKTRLTPGVDKRRVLRMARLDTFVALNAAWLVNSAILIVSAAVFFRNGQIVTQLDQAYHTLSPLAGPLAASLFAVALLASGISSSVTGTMAGQIVMEEFLHLKVAAWKRRIVTRLIVIVPTVIAIAAHAEPLQLLIISQVALSCVLPFAIIPLIDLTRRKKLMGEFRNSRLTTFAAVAILVFIVGANVLMLWSQLASA